jgi:hypothetical protein
MSAPDSSHPPIPDAPLALPSFLYEARPGSVFHQQTPARGETSKDHQSAFFGRVKNFDKANITNSSA